MLHGMLCWKAGPTCFLNAYASVSCRASWNVCVDTTTTTKTCALVWTMNGIWNGFSSALNVVFVNWILNVYVDDHGRLCHVAYRFSGL
jgi:hypothetical protein